MAWYATHKAYKKKDICRIYIYIYIYMEMHRACVVNPVTSMAHYYTGLLFSKGRSQEISPLDWTNKWLYVSFICVRAHMCLRAHTFASLSRQSVAAADCQSLAHYWSPLESERRNGKRVRTHIPVDISHDWPQISLFYKPGAFMFLGGVKKYQSIDFFFLFPGRIKNMPYT